MKINANDNMCYDDQNVNANVNKEYTCRWYIIYTLLILSINMLIKLF